ncbi:unnamed protein product [Effrenium voratum]|nr:unnamed protein product [Effrenium voratum]
MQKSSPMRNGKYVVLKVHEKHFFAVQHVDGFVSAHNHGSSSVMPLSFLTHISTSTDFHVFKLVLRSQKDEEYAHCASSLRGGALSKSVFTTHMKKCLCGNRVLAKAHDVKAIVYGMTGGIDQDIDEVLFLSNKMGFTVGYLKYHSMLEFRAFASTRAVQDIYQSELTPLKLHSSIVIGDEITGDALAAYESLSQMVTPKFTSSAVMVNALDKILHRHKQVNGIVLDRACSFIARASIEKFHQIKYWCGDYFHARGHRKSCPCNPHFVTKLHRRFKDVNTSAAEQVFSWFRNYSRILNESRPSRHAFKALLFAKRHNQAVKDYLNQFSHGKRKHAPTPYACSKKPAARCSKKPAAR